MSRPVMREIRRASGIFSSIAWLIFCCLLASIESSFSAWGTVRGKPSRMKLRTRQSRRGQSAVLVGEIRRRETRTNPSWHSLFSSSCFLIMLIMMSSETRPPCERAARCTSPERSASSSRRPKEDDEQTHGVHDLLGGDAELSLVRDLVPEHVAGGEVADLVLLLDRRGLGALACETCVAPSAMQKQKECMALWGDVPAPGGPMRIIRSWSAGVGTAAAAAFFMSFAVSLAEATAELIEPLADFSRPSTLSLSWRGRAGSGGAGRRRRAATRARRDERTVSARTQPPSASWARRTWEMRFLR
jgi:hypothetical protein